MLIKDLLYQINTLSVLGNTNADVQSVCIDSREVQQGSLFAAFKGTNADGHQFINQAIDKGAICIVCEEIPDEIKENICYVQVENSAEVVGIISHRFYGNPSEHFNLVGVTGTNGKTTVATLLHKLFTQLGHKCGLVSTVENLIGNEIIPATHTTPDAVHLNELLKKMQDAACEYVFMECSSHAIQQERLSGLNFKGAIFTNITHDHLDYHKTFDEYIRVKKSWFDHLPKSAFAISNLDDKRGKVMLQNTAAKKYYYSLQTVADFKGKILDNSLEGLHISINDVEMYCKLIGAFNAYNLLAVYGAAICLGQNANDVLVVLSSLSGAEGRFEYTLSNKEKVLGIVDYAHTPDALLNVLATIKNLRKGNENIITVVGCGGNRDAAKRPVMAEVACEYSDKVILTSDNPRNEDPLQIIKDMEAGVNVVMRKKAISIADRKEAIKTAVSLSNTNDIVLIAGKGHEKYQEINGVKHPFDDKQILKETFELLEK